jgi:hypothetical protein
MPVLIPPPIVRSIVASPVVNVNVHRTLSRLLKLDSPKFGDESSSHARRTITCASFNDIFAFFEISVGELRSNASMDLIPPE